MQASEEIKPVPYGGYLLLERLAMGGMAEVFLARPSGMADRLMALKRILPGIAADDEFVAMFIDEAKIAGQLDHPNIAKIMDIGKIDSSYFIAMEYVSGHDLRVLWDRTREQGAQGRGQMPLGIACHIVKRLAEGLDYAHRRRDAKGRPLGIIHRDVSPQNVLISYDGDVKIIDFGIAKAANRVVKTQTGILKGKFAYMAPEQARGEPTDHRADIFAIGVVLYELLTGERAFRADTDFALLEKVRRVDAAPIRQLRTDVPKEIERIVQKAMSKDAGSRYAWASLLAGDIDRFMSDQGMTTARDELAGFVRRVFRQEYVEEHRRLEAYRARAGAAQEVEPLVMARTQISARHHEGFSADDATHADVASVMSSLGSATTDGRKTEARLTPDELSRLRGDALRVVRADPLPPGEESLRRAPQPSAKARPPAMGPTVEVAPPRPREATGLRVAGPPRSDMAAPSMRSPSLPPLPVPPLPEPPVPEALLPEQSAVTRGGTSLRDQRTSNALVVSATVLGALFGAAIGAGMAVATRRPAPDTLIVTSPRDAEVRKHDDVICPQTPCAVRLGAGRHELFFRAAGGEPVSRTVEVSDDAPALLDVKIPRMVSGIRIETEPAGAAVLIGNVAINAQTPLTLPPVSSEQPIHLRIARDGFDTIDVVREAQTAETWRYQLPAMTTTWTVTVTPDDAVIDIGAQHRPGRAVVPVGKRPLVIRAIRPGCEPVSATLSGTGRSTEDQDITLTCKAFDGALAVEAAKRPASIRIDGTEIAKTSSIGAYPLPAGPHVVTLRNSRGKQEVHNVEVRRGETAVVISKLR